MRTLVAAAEPPQRPQPTITVSTGCRAALVCPAAIRQPATSTAANAVAVVYTWKG